VRRTDLVRNLSALSILAPLLVWALSPLGLLGVCAGIAVDAALRSLAGTWALQRLPERAALDWRGAIRVLAALAAATTVAYAVFAVAPARWPLALVAFLCAYVGCAFIVRPLAGAEVALLVRALGRRAAWMRRLAARAETRS
jgi:hypothetical protein